MHYCMVHADLHKLQRAVDHGDQMKNEPPTHRNTRRTDSKEIEKSSARELKLMQLQRSPNQKGYQEIGLSISWCLGGYIFFDSSRLDYFVVCAFLT